MTVRDIIKQNITIESKYLIATCDLQLVICIMIFQNKIMKLFNNTMYRKIVINLKMC